MDMMRAVEHDQFRPFPARGELLLQCRAIAHVLCQRRIRPPFRLCGPQSAQRPHTSASNRRSSRSCRIVDVKWSPIGRPTERLHKQAAGSSARV